MKSIRERIAHSLGADVVPGLIALSGADHTSLSMEIAKERAAQRSPADVLAQYERDRFVRPSRCDPFVLAALRMHALRVATEHGHLALELAPLAPLGTSSTVATASQHKIVSTARQTEAISDCSNVLALESASRRRRDPTGPAVHLTASARVTRAQALERPSLRRTSSSSSRRAPAAIRAGVASRRTRSHARSRCSSCCSIGSSTRDFRSARARCASHPTRATRPSPRACATR